MRKRLPIMAGAVLLQALWIVSAMGEDTTPAWSSTPATSAWAGVTYTYEPAATDSENNPLTYSAPTLPDWLKLEISHKDAIITTVFTGLTYQTAIAVDGAGNLFVSDGTLWRVDAQTRAITHLDDIGSTSGNFCTDRAGNIYISQYYSHRVLRYAKGTWSMSVVAGTGSAGDTGEGGVATQAQLFKPRGVNVDTSGKIYIHDSGNNKIKIVDPTSGMIRTFAENVNGSSAEYVYGGFTLDTKTNAYVAYQNTINKVMPGGTLTTRCSLPDGKAQIFGVTADFLDTLYFVDRQHGIVYKLPADSDTPHPIAGNGVQAYAGDNGPATNASIAWAEGVAVDQHGNVYIADSVNHRTRKVAGRFRLTGTPQPLHAGAHNVTLRVSDGRNIDQQTFEVNVHATAAPTHIEATDGLCSNRVFISWDPVLNASHYWIFRAHTGNFGEAILLAKCRGTFAVDYAAGGRATWQYWVLPFAGTYAGDLGGPDTGSCSVGAGRLDTYDSWAGYFHPANSAAREPTADPDADGMDNMREYVAWTDPTNKNSAGISVEVAALSSNTLSFTVQPTYLWRRYQVWAAPSLGSTNWIPVGPILPGNNRKLEYNVPMPSADWSTWFFRGCVSIPTESPIP